MMLDVMQLHVDQVYARMRIVCKLSELCCDRHCLCSYCSDGFVKDCDTIEYSTESSTR